MRLGPFLTLLLLNIAALASANPVIGSLLQNFHAVPTQPHQHKAFHAKGLLRKERLSVSENRGSMRQTYPRRQNDEQNNGSSVVSGADTIDTAKNINVSSDENFTHEPTEPAEIDEGQLQDPRFLHLRYPWVIFISLTGVCFAAAIIKFYGFPSALELQQLSKKKPSSRPSSPVEKEMEHLDPANHPHSV